MFILAYFHFRYLNDLSKVQWCTVIIMFISPVCIIMKVHQSQAIIYCIVLRIRKAFNGPIYSLRSLYPVSAVFQLAGDDSQAHCQAHTATAVRLKRKRHANSKAR